MRENLIVGLLFFAGSIVLAILARQIDRHAKVLWALALICLLGAFGIFIWPYKENIASGFRVAWYGTSSSNFQSSYEKIVDAFHKADYPTFDLGESLGGPYSERVIYALFDGAIVLWFKRTSAYGADDLYILSPYGSGERKFSHEIEELPTDEYYNQNAVRRILGLGAKSAPPLGPIALLSEKKSEYLKWLGARKFQFEYTIGNVFSQRFENGIRVGPLPRWDFRTNDHSEIITIPNKAEIRPRMQYDLFPDSGLPLPRPSPNESVPSCYTCENGP